jgi:bis(5'-nucleosyl)-tetraphosphatase (symmetrical)
MPTYAIGDIQGCCDEFEVLLERISFDPQRDRLWLVGDLVNRGPRSLDVLRLVRKLGQSVTSVLGNHDLHLLAAALSPSDQLKPKDTLGEIFSAPDRDELLDWLRHLPILHHDPELNYTMFHAGLPPQWDFAQARACAAELESALRDDEASTELFSHMYGDQPDRWSDELKGVDRLRFITNCFTRLRFCHSDGRLALRHKGSIADAPAGIVPWFRAPNRRTRDLRIVCGHWSALGLYEGDGVLSIDTGCVWGSTLCAVRLDQSAPPMHVPCSSSGLKPEIE